MQILISSILPNPHQPRKHLDQEYIAGLAKSIREQGLKDPITVEDNLDGTYVLVKGQCRILACQQNGMQEIEAIVRPLTNHHGKQRLIDAMIENVSRENMHAVDEGNGYKDMRAMGMSVRDISVTVGRNETRIRHMLDIAELEPEIQELLASGQLPHSFNAVDALRAIPESAARVRMAQKLAEKGATIKMIQRACAQYIEIKQAERQHRKLKAPALQVSRLSEPPFDELPEWDALYQVGRVPPWSKFTESMMATCDSCSLRPVASEKTCCDCPLVKFCETLLEAVK